MNVQLLVIDPQNDFCDPNGSLSVPGADADMRRVAAMIHRLRGRLDDIHVTLDSHRRVDISHPLWWRDARGREPAPFSRITAADMAAGRITTARQELAPRSFAYLEALERGGRYPHTIWPYHCLIGDAGHCVFADLAAELHAWEQRFVTVDFITKGSNPWTEHFSAVQAEVPDIDDPSTQTNAALLDTLEQADFVLLAGEALSHCLANTVRDIAERLGAPEYVAKLVLLTDASHNVPGFDAEGERFMRDMLARGMKTSTTVDFLA